MEWRLRALALAVVATLALPAGAAAAVRRLRVAVEDRSAASILRTGSLRLRITAPGHGHERVRLTLVERRHGSTPAGTVIGSHATLRITLTAATRERLRASLARCDRLDLRAAPNGGRPQDISLRVPRCRPRRGARDRLIGTPGGGYRRGLRRHGRAARFEVGAAVTDFSPPPAGQAPGDTSDCDRTGAFGGPRQFAFTEPYIDATGAGHYVPGDPYLDCNGNGRWDGNLLGGGSSTPRYYDKVADPVSARALVVSNGKHTIAVEVVDQEGLFNVYQQEIRDRVAADGVHLDNIFISANHDESAPDSLGLGGVTQLTSGVDDYWLQYFIARSAQAIEQAYRNLKPATIRYSEALEPANVRQCWSSYPFVDDQHIPILQAVGAHGKVIATLASVSQHDETLGFNGGTPELDAEQNWVSADWIGAFRNSLQARFGGVAIEMAGAVGSVESPEVYSRAISRTPQHEIEASHPAGCRTEFSTPYGDDTAGAHHVPLGYGGETKAFGDEMASAVAAAAIRARPSSTRTIWGARQNVCVPLGNELFELGAAIGVFAHRPGYNADCSVGFPVSPTGTTSGTSLLSQVASFRIGDGEFIAVPGEVFPFTYLGSFLGPQDLPDPTQPMTPMLMPHLHAPFRFVDGLAEDMLGYIFPPGNAVGVPTASNLNASDTDRFGCNHSDDAEAASPDSGTELGAALVKLLDAHGGSPETERRGRYVLADGALSRDPLGSGPDSLKCNTDQTFTATGRAIGIELPGGRVIHPLAWMSLSGLPQTRPDRDTRGYYDQKGRRVWLNVFPDVRLP